MSMTPDFRVHLDHLIQRQSIRYIPAVVNNNISISSQNWNKFEPTVQEDRALRYDDIRRNEWFSMIRKPDFQRETNAWTPEDCVEFLDSVVYGRIIPSLILWRNQENSFIYVLDGAHRLSVIRAWIIDDWGDKAGNYYTRRDESLIKETADRTRQIVRQRIGLFEDFNRAWMEHNAISDQGMAPKQVMDSKRYVQANFYARVMGSLQTLSIQWERGDYSSAEQSFLRINRRGQILDPWEANLIEYRSGSYARSIMCIANGGESGHYWPQPTPEESTPELLTRLNDFSTKAADIYRVLFVPPFRIPINSLNVPMMVAPAYFQKHKYLLEVVPLIVNREIATSEDQQLEIMKRDVNAPASSIIENAGQILSSLGDAIEHLISTTSSSRSLSIVPLFYWYNQQAQYARGLFYGFLYWLLTGTDEEITNRKLAFSTHRYRFEYLLFYLKPEIATLQERGGAGLFATRRVADFFQVFLELLQNHSTLTAESDELNELVLDILREKARINTRTRKQKTTRIFTKRDRSQINVRELFESAIRCHICGGVVNIEYGGLQYDHVEDYSVTRVTDPETGKPTHPFCNRYKKKILALQAGRENIILPKLDVSKKRKQAIEPEMEQMPINIFWGESDFPD